MAIDILLTAYKEPKTIAKAVKSVVDPAYSGYKGALRLIQISPDEETLNAGSKAFKAIGNAKAELVQIKDPGKGKPAALNLGLKKIKGDIVILTDGDVYFGENAVIKLISALEKNSKYGAVSGRPISIDPKNNMMGYFGHLFADANHYRREIDIKGEKLEKGKVFVKRHKFFPLSGYIMAIRSKYLKFSLPEDVLVDDAYISYMVFNQDAKLSYEENAIVYIKYPKNLSDYFKQKKRSTGGYIQLWKYGVVEEETKSRSPWHELELFWFPFKYAGNLRQIFWSFLLIPIRAWLWIQILIEQKILKKDFEKVWTRIESTK